MSNLINEYGNKIRQPEILDTSIYEKVIDKANELYKDYKEYCEKEHLYENMNFVYGGIYFCAKQIVEAEEKHKDEIAKLNTFIDKLAEEIRRNSGDCKFCELNDHCPCGNNYDHDFCPTPVLSRYNILKHFTK